MASEKMEIDKVIPARRGPVMATANYYCAIDLGAGSGRVILGRFGENQFDMQVVHRFPNSIQELAGHQRWNTRELFSEIKTALTKIAASGHEVASLGVDTWGVDYGLFDAQGNLLEEPVSYRDNRTEHVMERVFKLISKDELYQITGVQLLRLNTLFQLFAQKESRYWPEQTARLLMMPDIFHYYFSGKMVGEYTNASTTQLLNIDTREWDADLFERLHLPLTIMPGLVYPGAQIGILMPQMQKELGLPPLKIVAPATHDTGSAVAGTPLQKDWAYISSGTWSLVGIETRNPIVHERGLQYNFTNEGGAFGTIRFLKNVMGLWILERCRKEWQTQQQLLSYEQLSREMNAAPAFQAFIYPDDLRFLNPLSMTAAITSFLNETAQTVLQDQVGLSKIILESLALRYASIIAAIKHVTSQEIAGVHIIGGGSQNDFLNQATANATGLPVLAGPAEATAIGNLTVQAIANGRFEDITEAREYLSKTVRLKRYAPNDAEDWRQALQRYQQIESSL